MCVCMCVCMCVSVKFTYMSATTILWYGVWMDCCRTQDEEPLPLPIFIHANDVVQQRRFASRESACTDLFFDRFIYDSCTTVL